MKSDKVFVHAYPAVLAGLVCLCLFAGCDKEPEKEALPEVYPAEGNGYMDDPAFKQQLAKQKKERDGALGERERLIVEFEKLEKRCGSREAAEKTDEWRELAKQAEACGRAFESNRWETIRLMQDRVKRAQEDSARIREGKAVPVKQISK